MGGRTTTEDEVGDDDDDDDEVEVEVEKAMALEGGEEEFASVARGEGRSGGITLPMVVERRAAALWRVGRRRDPTMVNGER